MRSAIVGARCLAGAAALALATAGLAQDAPVPRADGYAYADSLVAGIRAIADFDVSVGCYPEGHPDAPGQDHLHQRDHRFRKAQVSGHCAEYTFLNGHQIRCSLKDHGQIVDDLKLTMRSRKIFMLFGELIACIG